MDGSFDFFDIASFISKYCNSIHLIREKDFFHKLYFLLFLIPYAPKRASFYSSPINFTQYGFSPVLSFASIISHFSYSIHPFLPGSSTFPPAVLTCLRYFLNPSIAIHSSDVPEQFELFVSNSIYYWFLLYHSSNMSPNFENVILSTDEEFLDR